MSTPKHLGGKKSSESGKQITKKSLEFRKYAYTQKASPGKTLGKVNNVLLGKQPREKGTQNGLSGCCELTLLILAALECFPSFLYKMEFSLFSPSNGWNDQLLS